MAPMHVQNAREVPEYEIDPTELDFSNSVDITKVRLMSHIIWGKVLYYGVGNGFYFVLRGLIQVHGDTRQRLLLSS